MPIYLNSTKVGSNAYDVHSAVSTKLNKIKMGNTDVWQGLPPYYEELKNGQVLTEAQWLEFLNGDGIAAVIANSDQANFRGKNITINNSIVSNYTSWKIADFNHDNSSNTVDLIQNNHFHPDWFGNTQYYNNSRAREWIINTYLPGFSTNIKAKLQIMNVSSNGSTLNDKIKLLSLTEMNLSSSYSLTEGTPYPIFNSADDRIRDGEGGYWWLRSRNTRSGYQDRIWTISRYSGNADEYSTIGNNGYTILPCIRFA